MTKLKKRLNAYPRLKAALEKARYNLEEKQLIIRGKDAERFAIVALYDLINSASVQIHITRNNAKLGNIPSLAVAPWLTCNNKECYRSGACYGLKFRYLSIFKFLDMIENTYLLGSRPEEFKKQINAFFALNKIATFFRWFENGDFPSERSVSVFNEIARENPNVKFLCMSKQYERVNNFLAKNGGKCEENLIIRFSKFSYSGLIEIENPFNLPLTDCIGSEEERKEGAFLCPGAKYGCAACLGCWYAKQEIDFLKH